AGGWLGSAMSRALAEAGANVVTTSRDAERAGECAAALPAVGGQRHCGVALDHLDEASIGRAFAEALDRAGRIDILVNHGHAANAADHATVTAEAVQRSLANATGYFLLARKLRDHAASRGGGGSVVMIGSMYGVVGSYPEAYEGIVPASPVAYHALKGGIV